MKTKTIIICLNLMIFLAACNQPKSDKKQAITYLCNYFQIISPVVDAMEVFSKDVTEKVYSHANNIYELPASRRIEIIDQIIKADDIFLVKLSAAVKELKQLEPIDDTLKLGDKTCHIFALTQDFLSTDFKEICVAVRDSLEFLPDDYFDMPRAKTLELTRLNNSVADLQTDFYKVHKLKDEDIDKLNKNCAGFK